MAEGSAAGFGTFSARKEALNRLERALEKFPPLLKRTFISCESEEEVSDVRTSEFRVMQWNVLADALSASSPTQNFVKCPSDSLQWSNRKLRSLQEILLYDPDIIALEEVDHYEDYYLPSLSKLGYKGLFAAKRDSPCLKFPNNSGPDGCALFYDAERFSLVNHKDVALKDSNGLLTSQVALIVNLFDQVQGRTLCCAVTHLKAKEGFEELRCSQGNALLKYVSESLGDNDKSVLIFGDFNAEPTEPVCQLMGENQYLCMKNAYVSATGNNPEFTTWKIRPDKEVEHTIDFVWYTPNLSVTGCLKVPERDSVPANRLPCFQYPSDHLSLVFDFRWGC